MDYELVIEDLTNPQEPLILHQAARGSLRQIWNGSDDKTQPIVGGEYEFTLENFSGVDGLYSEYFTSDENRFRLTQRVFSTGEIVFQGFFLPETYSEPYENGVHYVQFSAVDGLGLLRGKKLPPEFYENEHFVTDALAQLLTLTGINFDIYLAPAIVNHLNKKWHQIVFDGRKYWDIDTLPSAYEILEELVSSMRCQLFQSQGRWYIEGVNFRHLKTVKFDTYNLSGTFLGSFDIEKNVKTVYWSPTPTISTVPGMREVSVSHEAAMLVLSEEVFQETNISWAKSVGNFDFVARHWDYTHYLPKIIYPEYYLELPVSDAAVLNVSNKIELKEKKYVLKGTKVRIKLAFELLPWYGSISETRKTDNRVSGIWIDMQVYKISLNATPLFYNASTIIGDATRLVFQDDLKTDVNLEFVAQENGYINIELFEPRGILTETWIEAVRVLNLEIENIDQRDNFIYTEDLNLDSSRTREIDLALSDDISLESKCFYLEKTREFEINADTVVKVPIRYGRQQNGKNYAIVSVEGAVLIQQYPNNVFYRVFILVNNPIVHFNLNGGEEMAIETEEYYDGGSFFIPDNFYVHVQPYKPATIDRTEWMKWSDAVYKIEQKPYAQVVAEIEGKLFKEPHIMIEATVQNPIKFNDLIEFAYKGVKKYFVPTNINWNPDDNETQVTLIEGVYAGASLGNIPPYVDAGPDIMIGTSATSAQITQAVVNDPDGSISSLLWERISGDAGESYSSNAALNPLISGLLGNAYTFQLTATDNTGATASDTMHVFRVGDYNIVLTLISSEEFSGDSVGGERYQNYLKLKETWQLEIVENLPVNVSVNLFFDVTLGMNSTNDSSNGHSAIKVFKYGNLSFMKNFSTSIPDEQTFSAFFQVNKPDVITIEFESEIKINTGQTIADAYVAIEFNKAVFVNGMGTITNLPFKKELKAII